MKWITHLLLISSAIFGYSLNGHAQTKKLIGIIKDKQSDEPIPFASIIIKSSKTGVLTDTVGKFILLINNSTIVDTVEIQNVGYKPLLVPTALFKDSTPIIIKIEVLPPSTETVVKSKYNRALWFWKKIMQHKPNNDKTKWDNYGYEVYNKLELDLDNVNKDKLSEKKILKPLSFVLVYVDTTSEDKPYLPVYLTETLSDFYFQKNPKKYYELIKAAKTNGIDNESLVKQLGGMYQNVNVYNNFIPVFDKQFISPFNDNADKYYHFKLLDTQYLNKKRLVHFRFTPKTIGADVFEGDCWINDTLFAVQKITLRPSVDANINHIKGLTIIQEYKLLQDSIWFLYKDKFVADIIPLGKNKLALKGRKTTTYKNVILNSALVSQKLAAIKKAEKIDVQENSLEKQDSFWTKNRHEELNKNEQTVYKVLDTLQKNPTYVRYRNTLNFLTTGVKDIGNIRIGPWFYWLSGNNFEGNRVRFDISTNKGFNKHLYLHGYLAYGFDDKRYKGKFEARYLINNDPWTYIHASYKNDFDNGQIYFDQLSTDNLFATWSRRSGIPFKFQYAQEKKLEFFRETNSGLSYGLTLASKNFKALLNLPDEAFFTTAPNDPFNSFEATVRLKYAFSERFVEENFYRTSLGSEYPIINLRLTHGFKNVLKSSYNYNKIDVNISDKVKVAPYGLLQYNVFAGKVFGTIPYQFLEIMPGNELYYYNKYAFNLMKRFEFIADEFVGLNFEHNIGSGLFKYTSITRKLKLRQLYTIKVVTGNLSDENKALNFVGNYPFKSLNKNIYLELGTGIDNILKLFRLDFVWRVLPSTNVKEAQTARFAMFGSFSVVF